MDIDRTRPRTINLETPHFIVRTLGPADATEAWRDWLIDPRTAAMLNARPEHLSIEEIRAYIAGFDSVNAHLLGIFDKEDGRLIGIRAIYIDPKRREFLVNVLVGETQARNKGARTESREVMYRYFFEDMDLECARGSVVSTNEGVLRMMDRNGWIREHKNQKAAASGQGTVDLIHLRLTRDAWRAKTAERAAAQSS